MKPFVVGEVEDTSSDTLKGGIVYDGN